MFLCLKKNEYQDNEMGKKQGLETHCFTAFNLSASFLESSVMNETAKDLSAEVSLVRVYIINNGKAAQWNGKNILCEQSLNM